MHACNLTVFWGQFPILQCLTIVYSDALLQQVRMTTNFLSLASSNSMKIMPQSMTTSSTSPRLGRQGLLQTCFSAHCIAMYVALKSVHASYWSDEEAVLFHCQILEEVFNFALPNNSCLGHLWALLEFQCKLQPSEHHQFSEQPDLQTVVILAVLNMLGSENSGSLYVEMNMTPCSRR